MAREAEFKKQRVFNTGNGVAKPVWTNANRVNHANQFVPRLVQLNAGRQNINSIRPNVNTGRTNVNLVRPRVNTGSSNVNTIRSRQPVRVKTSNSFSPKRPQVNQFNQRGHFCKSYSSVRRPFAKTTAHMSHFHAVKGNWGSAVKTSACYNWRNSKPNSNCNSGPTFIRTVNAKGPQGRPKSKKAWVTRKSSTNSKKEEILTAPQQEKKVSSTDTSEDNPKILAFRRELEETALKHSGKVSKNTSTSTPSVNTGNVPVNTGSFDPDDSPMPELKIFHKYETRIFDEASYDEEGVITDFNSLPTEIEVSPTPTLRIHNIHPKSQNLGDPKSVVQTRSKEEPKKISKALQDDSWVQAMQEELLQFKLQQVWVLGRRY
ncbi:hypothetical protein Tco_1363670 [Tanacetum coccineum]